MTDICQFLELLVLDVNYEAGLFFIVYLHDVRPIVKQMLVRPIVKQMLVSLDGKVPEDLGVVIPDYFFGFYPPVFTMPKIFLSAYGPIYYLRPCCCVSQSTPSLRACCSLW